MSNFAGFILFLKNTIFTEYVAAAATSFVIGNGLMYAYNHYATNGDASGGGMTVTAEEPGFLIFRPLVEHFRTMPAASNPVSYCLTMDFRACAERMPEASMVGNWCVTTDNVTCQYGAVSN
jgi:hypothetical protein